MTVITMTLSVGVENDEGRPPEGERRRSRKRA